MLQDEHIWGDLDYCDGCRKYKPANAFDEAEHETLLQDRGFGTWQTVIESIVVGSTQHCRRCRTKSITLPIEGRVEWVEQGHPIEEMISFGLRKLGWQEVLVDREGDFTGVSRGCWVM